MSRFQRKFTELKVQLDTVINSQGTLLQSIVVRFPLIFHCIRVPSSCHFAGNETKSFVFDTMELIQIHTCIKFEEWTSTAGANQNTGHFVVITDARRRYVY